MTNRVKAMILLAFYLRVSTSKQAQEGYSLEGQLQACIKKAQEEYGTDVTWEVFVDEGISGKDLEHRPELQRMLREIQNGKFDGVISWKVSRLSRKLSDALRIVDSMSKSGVEFISIKEGRYSSSVDRLTFNMLASVAEYQREELAENVQLGMTQRASEGLWNGGQVLGYRSEEKVLIPAPKEAAVVELIFRKFTEEDYGTKKLVNWLNANGYRTKNGKPFRVDCIHRILRNPVYKGFIRFNQVTNWSEKRRRGKNDNPLIVKGAHEALVSEATWDQAQRMLDSRSTGTPRQYSGTFPFTGLIKCPQCGSFMTSMYGSKRKDGSKPRYYVCGAYHNSGISICRSNTIRADALEGSIWERLVSAMTTEDTLRQLSDEINAHIARQNKRKPVDETQHLSIRLKNLEDQKKRIHAGFEKGIYTMAETTEKLKPLRESITEVERELASLSQFDADGSTSALLPVTPAHLKRQLQEFMTLKEFLDVKELRQLLVASIKRIEVQEKSLKKVHFSFILGDEAGATGSDFESDPVDPIHTNLDRYGLYRAIFRPKNRYLFMIRFPPGNPDAAIELLQ